MVVISILTSIFAFVLTAMIIFLVTNKIFTFVITYEKFTFIPTVIFSFIILTFIFIIAIIFIVTFALSCIVSRLNELRSVNDPPSSVQRAIVDKSQVVTFVFCWSDNTWLFIPELFE